MDEYLLAIVVWCAVGVVAAVAMYLGHLRVERRRARPSAALSAGRDSTLVGTVVAAEGEIPSPVIDGPPCVLWQVRSYRMRHANRSRVFAVDSAVAGRVWVDVEPGRVWGGRGDRPVVLRGRGVSWWVREEGAAWREVSQRTGENDLGDPAFTDALAGVSDAAEDARGPWPVHVACVRVGDEVIVRGRFESLTTESGTVDASSGGVGRYRVKRGPGWTSQIVIHVGGAPAFGSPWTRLLRRLPVLTLGGTLVGVMLWMLADAMLGIRIVQFLGLESLVTK